MKARPRAPRPPKTRSAKRSRRCCYEEQATDKRRVAERRRGSPKQRTQKSEKHGHSRPFFFSTLVRRSRSSPRSRSLAVPTHERNHSGPVPYLAPSARSRRVFLRAAFDDGDELLARRSRRSRVPEFGDDHSNGWRTPTDEPNSLIGQRVLTNSVSAARTPRSAAAPIAWPKGWDRFQSSSSALAEKE